MGCWGEMKSPRRGIKHRYVCMVVTGSMPIAAISFGGYNGGAQQPPCQDVWYYHTQLAAIKKCWKLSVGSQRKRVNDPHLAAFLNAGSCPHGSQRLVSSDTHLAPSLIGGRCPKGSQRKWVIDPTSRSTS